MKIYEDRNQHKNAHEAKHEYWELQGIEVVRDYRLPVGDYILANDKTEDLIERKSKRGVDVKIMDFLGTYTRVVDTKYGLQEIYSDIVGKDHERFKDSYVFALNNHIEYIVLIEESGFNSIEDVAKWRNPRREKWFQIKALHERGKALKVKISNKPPAPSETLAKSMQTIAEKYDVRFEFCSPEKSGEKVIELLTEDTVNPHMT